MEDLNDLYYFAEVAQHGGFTAAARALKVPKSRLSRRIAELEERLGARLLQRTTRRLHLTPLGEDFLRHCRAMVVEAQAAQELIEQGLSEPRGRIRASCPVLLAQQQLEPLLPGFLARYPQITLDLEVSNRRVDVVAEGFDVAIRARTPPLQDGELVAKPLGIAPRYIVAAPALIEACGGIAEPEDLRGIPSLSLASADGRHLWTLQHADGTALSIEHRPRLVTDEMHLLLAAACAGLGAALLPEMLCRNAFHGDRLQRVLPQWRAPHDLIYAAYVSRRRNIPAVQAFLDFLGQEIGPRLTQA